MIASTRLQAGLSTIVAYRVSRLSIKPPETSTTNVVGTVRSDYAIPREYLFGGCDDFNAGRYYGHSDAVMLLIKLLVGLLLGFSTLMPSGALGHDHGRPDLNQWFKSLAVQSGFCCDGADSNAIDDADWESLNGHYRVRINGQWIDVPDSAVLKQPNLDGRTMVWPYYINGSPVIRCFIPGVMT